MWKLQRPGFFVLLFAVIAPGAIALAGSSTWLNPSGGSWTNANNWSGGIIADGAGSTANFTTCSLSNDVMVRLDAPRTIGSLSFDDKSTPIHNWHVQGGGAHTLSLSGSSPTITVLNGVANVELPLLGTSGLLKGGGGKLMLASPLLYSGATIVNAGTLQLSNATFSASNHLNIAGATACVESLGTLSLAVNTSSTAIDVTGAGKLLLISTVSSESVPDIYFGPNHTANNCWSARLAAAVDLGSTQRFIHGKTGHNGVGPYGLAGADCQFAGPISGTGGLTFIAQNNWTGSGPMEVPFALNAANTFTGPVEIRRGSVYLGHSQALTRGNVLTFNPRSEHNARLFLYGHNALVSDLSSPGSGAALIANGNLKSGATVTLGAVNLVVTQNLDGVFSGTIADVFPEYTGSGTGTTGPLNITKAGPGRLRLTGTCAHSGTTEVVEGVLEVNGVFEQSPVRVRSDARLAGMGEIHGPVELGTAAMLEPGSGAIGTLKIMNSLTLDGISVLELSKTGTTLANDRVTGMSSVRYGGTLTVTNIGDVRTGALSAGDTFLLFEATSRTGSFADIALPPLSAGLEWDTQNLLVNGSITVVGTNSGPTVVQQPQDVTVTEGGKAVLTVVAAGVKPLSFQWYKGSQPVPSAVSPTYQLTSAGTNDSGAYSAVVTNLFGSSTSAVAILNVYSMVASPVTNGLQVYLNFDNTLAGQAGTTNSGSLYTGGAVRGPRYKPGVVGEAATFSNSPTPGQPDDWAITLGNLEWIYAGNFSVSLWERSMSSGDGALIGNKDWSSGANVGWVISTLNSKNLNYAGSGGTRCDVGLNPPFSDAQWHLVTVAFDRQLNQVITYMDGVAVSTTTISPSGMASLNAGFPTLVGSSGNGAWSGAGDLDELAIWNRVLTAQEVAGIYGAGLRGRPLSTALPGSPPLIVQQPTGSTVAMGSTAVFSVSLDGTGPFEYQWRFNGTNIAGATNATLVLQGVSSAAQGLYTVLVSNGTGAVLSSSALLSVYRLEVTGQWDFDRADLSATVGAELEYAQPGAPAAFPLVAVDGQEARTLAATGGVAERGLYQRHGAHPNGGGRFVNQYTLLLDVLLGAPAMGPSRGLLESNPFGGAESEAELYIGESTEIPGTFGVGAEAELRGALAANTWHRLAFVVDLLAAPGHQLKLYAGGQALGTLPLSGGIDGRHALGPAALLFSSGTSNSAPILVNSVQFVNGWLGAEAIAALGRPTADGLPTGNAALRITSVNRQASTLTLSWSGPDGQVQLQKSNSVSEPVWEDIGTFGTNRTISVPLEGMRTFYRVQQLAPPVRVGQLPLGEQVVPSQQVLRAAGQQVQFSGRPVDLVLSADGRDLYVKNMNNLVVIDTVSWRVKQTLGYPGGGASMHGIAINQDASRVYVTGSGNELYEWAIAGSKLVTFSRTISLPPDSYPCGIALSSDGARAYVCLSKLNKLCEVELLGGTVLRQISVGIAPWDVVLSPSGREAYVSDWGGRMPLPGEPSAPSAGTQVLIDNRGVAASGAVSFVDLSTGTETAKISTGLHPSDLELSKDGSKLYVANANSDTITAIETANQRIFETILVRPDPAFPYGSAATGLALSGDGRSLYVTSGGNNTLAVVSLAGEQRTNSIVQGFIPTDWYPGAVAIDGDTNLYVVNVKGLGTRLGQPATVNWQINAFLGSAGKIAIPDTDRLGKYTAQSFEDGRIREIKKAHEPPRSNKPAVPVPLRRGEPSVFKHVLYIIKENKTYDQIFGDFPQANGEPALCIYPRFVTPNHHALAEQYVLLDNFYCNGVNSSDGHSWSTEANVTDHLEKSFGGFSRSYTFGDDPLTYSSSGFIWNNVLEHGLTFRNYGEMDYASTSPAATWQQIYADFTNRTGKIRYVQNIGIDSLRSFSSTNVPGWNMGIPDVVRAEGFIKELNQAQARGTWESFHLLYLPNDHTGGPPTPRAQVADNDLALGQVVEAVTKSIFGTNTVIFVIEDDPQSGYDHVDAHRSICLVISPYTRRGKVVSTFYNQAGVIHTMERILGLPPMNQQDAMAPLMFDCFTTTPDFRPYTALTNNVDLAEGAFQAKTASTVTERYWAKELKKMDFSRPDRINDDLFNRYIWHTIKGSEPYPAQFVGAHGKGLKRLGLALDKKAAADWDD